MVGLLEHEAAVVLGAAIDAALVPAQPQHSEGIASLTESELIVSLRQEVASLRRRVLSQTRHGERSAAAPGSGVALHRDLCTSAVPTVRGAEIDVVYQPAEAVGGDAYTAVRLDEHRVAIAMIDATGHGVGASVLAAYVQHSMRAALRRAAQDEHACPSKILQAVNRDVCDAHLSDCQFVAAVVVLYDERSRMVRLARAGMPYPVRLSRSDASSKLEPGGPLLGAVELATFPEVALSLEPGDTLVLHTDGLEHCLADPAGRPHPDVAGSVWLRSLQHRDLTAALAGLDGLCGGDHAEDDVTVITLRVDRV